MSENIPKGSLWMLGYLAKKLAEAKKEWFDAVDKVNEEYDDVDIPLINVLPLIDAVYDAGCAESNLKSLLNFIEEKLDEILNRAKEIEGK